MTSLRTIGMAVLVAVIAIQVSVAGVTASGHLVTVSEHDTVSDFENGTLDDLKAVDDTDDYVTFSDGPSEKLSRPGQNVGSVDNYDHPTGVRVELDANVSEVSYDVPSVSTDTGADTAVIYDENWNVVETTSIDADDTATFADVSLSPGTYGFGIDGTGYTREQEDDPMPINASWGAVTEGFYRASDSFIADDTWYGVKAVNVTEVSDGDGNYTSATHTADADQGAVDLQLGTDEQATVEWQFHDGNSWQTHATTTVTSSGEHTTDLSTKDATDWRVDIRLESDQTSPSAQINSDSVSFDPAAPIIDNSSADPANGETVTEEPVEFTINVSDPDFDTPQSDELTAALIVEGSQVGTDTLTSNGTASVTHNLNSIGETDYHWNVSDDYGEWTTSDTFTFTTPSNVTFRYEDNATKKVTGANVTTTFYSEDGTTIVKRSDDDGDGEISLSGLPNTEFVATVQADGYYNRRVFITSIFEQQNIYLLNDTDHPNAVSNTFVYEDRTGNFPPGDTALKVQRGVDVDGDDNFTWETVAGDYWGGTGEFPFTGEYQARYRLIIQNTETGRERLVGTHIPDSDGAKNIIVGQIEWNAENGTGQFFDSKLRTEDNEIVFRYTDPTNATTDLRIEVFEPGNESNTIYDDNFTGTYGDLEATIAITEEQSEESWVVKYSAQHDIDGTISGQTTVGGTPFALPVDSWLLGTLCWILVTFIATLYGPRTATLGAWALVGMAAMLSLFQWVDIPTASLLIAVGIAAGGTFYNQASP